MRFYCLFLCALATLNFSVLFAQGFYDIETINTIEISFEESNWDELLDGLASVGEDRLTGSVIINGQPFDSVGVRYKGNSSYNENNAKNPFNIKLDYIIDDQEYENYGTIKLSNGYKDPSFVREVLGYEIARKYFPAPLSNYANVYVNGEYIGLYTSNQDVDKQFMRTYFVDDENARFKGEINEAKGPSGGVWQYLGPDSSDYATRFVIESDTGWDELISFLYTLNNNNSEVSQELNIDRHLWFLAFSNLLVNLDGPVNNPQNHYLFQDMSGRFNPIPWDLNECFGVFSMLQTSTFPLSTEDLQELDPFLNISEEDFPVISKILTNEEYKKMYVAHMKTIIDENFSNGWYESRAYEIQDIIADDYQSDGNTFYTYSEFQQNITSSVGSMGPPPNQMVPGIMEIMESRIDYLLSVSEFSLQPPVISNPEYSPESAGPGEEIFFTAEFEYTDNAWMAYRYDNFSKFTKISMYDDGIHNDGDAGDGIYGISFVPEASEINYYFYADNSDAAAFLPVRAEYEFFTFELDTDVVINEFLASNQNGQTDSNGETDDWIELYNNGSDPVDLSGYYLSDKPDETSKWVFPDTTIAAGAYLIVWADGDTLQPGLHANFKLSAGGEAVVLSAPDTSLIDQCSFTSQTEDISFGRYPNGVGEFCLMPPTFEAENMQESASEEVTHDLSFSLYPNPASDEIKVNITSSIKETVEIRIFNAMGNLIYHTCTDNTDMCISLADMAPGMYVIYVRDSASSRHLKFIKY